MSFFKFSISYSTAALNQPACNASFNHSYSC